MILVLVTTAHLFVVSPVMVESSSASAALLPIPAEVSSRATDKMLVNTIDTSEDECKSISASAYSLLLHSLAVRQRDSVTMGSLRTKKRREMRPFPPDSVSWISCSLFGVLF
jgi:hypothetical protein